ncbi:hypothetical protein Hanom_Chr02g00145741 [Helianthus anomalus]
MILIIYIAHVTRAELHSFGTLIRPIRCDFRYQTHNQFCRLDLYVPLVVAT